VGADDLARRVDDRRADLPLAAGGDERDPGAGQRELPARRALLFPYEAGHARDDEQEEHRRCPDHDEHVDVADVLCEVDARRDEAREREQRKAQPRQARPRVRCGLLERAHGRMKRGRSPDDEVRDPPHVVDELVVVRPIQQRVVVRAVGDEQGDHARDEEVEGGGALAGVDGKADRGGEEQDVPERVRRRDGLGQWREPREVEVRRDEEDPREQREPDREDHGVDRGAAVGRGIPPPDEQEEAADERGVDSEVDGVAGRGKADRSAEELGVAVGVEVAGDIEELADEEERPGKPRLRPVHPHRDADGGRREEANEVDQPRVALHARERQVTPGQRGRADEVPEPDGAPRRV
jgi:hypothetical protein